MYTFEIFRTFLRLGCQPSRSKFRERCPIATFRLAKFRQSENRGSELYLRQELEVLIGFPSEGAFSFAGIPTRIGDSINVWHDVTKDDRFLIPTEAYEPCSASITVVANWVAGLKK